MKTKFLAIFLLIFVFSTVLFAEDVNKPKFPGKFGIEFMQRVDYNAHEHMTKAISRLISDAVYTRTELKLSLAIPVTEFYTIALWTKDRLELRVNVDGTSDVGIRVRNRFYTGINNIFSIPKIMKVGINFESRIQNELRPGYPMIPTVVRLSPFLTFNGKYDFGLSWYVVQFFEFYLNPSVWENGSDGDNHETWVSFDLEGHYGVSFEFFHFFAPEWLGCSFAIEEFLLITLDQFMTHSEIRKWLYFETFAGLKFDIYKIKPSIGFFMWNQYAPGNIQDYWALRDVFDVRMGMKTGVSYTHEWFSFNIDYFGGVNVQKENAKWENAVETYVKIKY